MCFYLHKIVLLFYFSQLQAYKQIRAQTLSKIYSFQLSIHKFEAHIALC